MADNCINKIDNVVKSILKTMELASEYGGAESKDIKVYSAMMEKVCQIEANYKHGKEAMEKCSTITDPAQMENMFNAEMRNAKNCNAKNTTRYKDFMAQSTVIFEGEQAQHHATGDNDMSMQQVFSEFDPITKRRLENPVRNKICKHVYEKNSVEQLLAQNPRLRCPIAGCPNTKHIILTDLMDDIVLKRKLAQTLNDSLNDSQND